MHERYIIDQEALLENLDGWVKVKLKQELNIEERWRIVADLCKGCNNKKIFCSRDITAFASHSSPAEALLHELIKRCVTAKYFLQLLEEAQLESLSDKFKSYDELVIEEETIVPSLNDIKLGSDVRLTINVKGFPKPTFTWFKGETFLNKSTNVLKIEKFCAEDEGIYLCYIQQCHKNKIVELWSKPFHLFLTPSPPFIIVHPQDSKLLEGEKLVVSCQGTGWPQPSYLWMRNNELVSLATANELQIEKVKLSDAGQYQCILKNSAGECASQTVFIEVNCKANTGSCEKPEIVSHPILCESDPQRSIGQSFSVVCSARCNQNVVFTWIVNGKELNESNNPLYTILTSASAPDFTSCLLYSVSHGDGTNVRVLCSVRSPDASALSKEVCVKVAPGKGPQQFTAGTKWALFVANTDYTAGSLPPLFTPLSDHQLLAKKLTALDFHCLLLTNLKRTEFKNAVKIFSQVIKPNDYVVFCYAGHGLLSTVDQLLPVPDAPGEIETVSAAWVQSVLQTRSPALLFVVLDMCRHICLDDLQVRCEPVKLGAHRNCVVLHATSEGFQALEDPNTTSVLTSSLVQHLHDDVDLVSVARSVLRDIAHKPCYVRSEQIPKLDINMWESRSLRDPVAFIDPDQERRWASLTQLPQKKVVQTYVDGNEVTVTVSCLPGGDTQLVANVVRIVLEIHCTNPPPPPMSLAFNVKNSIKSLGRFSNKMVYEMAAVHTLKIPLILTVAFKSRSSSEVTKQEIPLGFPGISRLKLDQRSPATLRADDRNAGFNIQTS